MSHSNPAGSHGGTILPIQRTFAKFQLAFSVVFMLASLAAGVSGVIVPMQQMQAAKQWGQTACVITKSNVVYGTGRSRTKRRSRPTYKLSLAYQYQYGGQLYSDTTYSFDDTQLSGLKEASQVAKQLPVGTPTVCWVNPASPSEAVLKRDAQQPAIFMAVPVILFALGLGLGLNALKTIRTP